MTDLDTQVRAKQPEHDEQARLYAEFLAAGGEPQIIPRGAMTTAGWSPRQLVNPSNVTKAMRLEEIQAARDGQRAESASLPLPRSVKVAGPPIRQKREHGPAPAGSLQREALDALAEHGPMTARQMADAKGWKPVLTAQRLDKLRADGLIYSTGKKPSTLWHLVKP